MSRLEQSMETIQYVKGETDEVILFNSFGKDSLVTLDLIAPHFRRVVNVFMYFVPGLEHIDRYIRQVLTRYNNVELRQVPHFCLSYIRREGIYCTADKTQKARRLRDVVADIRKETGLFYTFLGMKKADSMNRRLMLGNYEADHYVNAGLCYPLATWTNREVLAYMRQNRLPEPVRYSKKTGGGVGFDKDCFLWLEKNFPQDLKRIYQQYPQSERILFEVHYKRI